MEHTARDSFSEDRASSYYDNNDHKNFRGYGSNSTLTCRNCDREGHKSHECPEPRRGRKCFKCGREGHTPRYCTSGSSEDYDRGNSNIGSGRQKDSSTWNNNGSITWGNQNSYENKVKDDHTLGPQGNSWNKAGSASSQGVYNNIQDDDSKEKPADGSWSKTAGNWETKAENTSQTSDWGSKTAEDFGWATNDNRQGRGNEIMRSEKHNKGPDDSKAQEQTTKSPRSNNEQYNNSNGWKKDSSFNNTSRSIQDKGGADPRDKIRNDNNTWASQKNSWNKTGGSNTQNSDASSTLQYKQAESKSAGDNWEAKTENTTRTNNWGSKSAEDFGWRDTDENKQGRGNEILRSEKHNKGPDDNKAQVQTTKSPRSNAALNNRAWW